MRGDPLRMILKAEAPVHEACQVRTVGQAVRHHQLVLQVQDILCCKYQGRTESQMILFKPDREARTCESPGRRGRSRQTIAWPTKVEVKVDQN